MRLLFFTKESFHILFTALTYTLLPFVVLTMLTSRVDLIPGFNSFTVLTGSMEPLIPTGSVVYTAQSGSYKVGDIISFESGKINITHRIAEVVKQDGRTFYRTKGDANSSIDNQLVSSSQIIGEIMFHVPALGKFMTFLRSLPGFLLLIVLPTLVFIGFELWNIKKEVEKETEKRVLKKVLENMHAYM